MPEPDLFGGAKLPSPDQTPTRQASAQAAPLAEKLRPRSLAEVAGQAHLLGEGGTLTLMLKRGALASLILWGPPGVGKTTIARLLADAASLRFCQVSAVFSGVSDLKKIFEDATRFASNGQRTLLFVDEIHRFNRAQQDAFLPVMEQGTITLIGATTENPSFALNGALLSRAQVFVLKRLDDDAMETLLARAEHLTGQALPLTPSARESLRAMADGDGRALLNMAEQLFALPDATEIDETTLTTLLARRAALYDRDREEHYNLISALHKSMRGSDPDAALYWLARMLSGGEDPRYIARRITRFASEDIGLADPQALAAWEAYERLGSPEGEICIAQAVLYLATAPKSNAAYKALGAANRAAKETGSLMPPKNILNAPTKLMKTLGYGQGYTYDHDTDDGFSGDNYFPEGMGRPDFYRPPERGFEREIVRRLAYWAKLREEKP